ncbi:DUF2231 domain-containing protein [Nocardioides luteus]|uniref:DUF2231 domain-containing protein n=1 Tax=Nocardioides luteus TaxID=1844 RepID=A0A1J4N9Q0_9ACTN|nr:DUF2231 domain-containing protein [Nocardioides luteus]OIJ27703.1 hypothetical protein UG56_006810 [Nocardioides luteus]
MFDLVNGLPVHPLVVHAVVVLLPLSIIGTIAIAVRPGWRVRYGNLVVATSLVATILVPVASSSGEALQSRVGNPGEHAELGDQLIWFALPVLILGAVLVWMSHRQHRADSAASARGGHRAVTVVAALAVLAGLAAGVQVYRVGDSGARAAWGDQVSAPR